MVTPVLNFKSNYGVIIVLQLSPLPRASLPISDLKKKN